jgi:hypothetical protein
MPRRAEQFLAFIKSAHGYYSNYPVYAPVVGNGALGRPYNVLANKAIGNGVADDYKSIQGVLNALASSNGGGVAEFPAGYTFGVSQPLVVPGNFVYLKGPGRNRDFSDTPTFPNNLTTFPPMCAIKPLSNFPIGQPLITFGSLSNSYIRIR